MSNLEQAKKLAVELGLEEPPVDEDAAFLAADIGMGAEPPQEPFRDLEIIESEILFYKRNAGQAIIEIGKRLNEAKAQLSHGEWLPWLREKVDISERSAQDFMRLAREYSKSAEIADLGASKALALLALPVSERERFVSEKHEVDGVEKSVADMTAKELKKAIEERDAARQTMEAMKARAEAAEESRAKMETDMAALKNLQESAKAAEVEARRELEKVRAELQALRDKPVEVAVEVDQEAVSRAAEEARTAAEAEWREKLAAAERKLNDAAGERKALEDKITELRKKAKHAGTEGKEENARLSGEVDALKKQLAMSDAKIITFKAKLENMNAAFSGVESALGEMEPELREKMSAAACAQLDIWKKALAGRK